MSQIVRRSSLLRRCANPVLARLHGARSASTVMHPRGRVVILGSGWAGFKMLRNLDRKNYNVVMVSPRNYFVFTPLLASTAAGTLEFRCVLESVRSHSKGMQFYEARCDSIGNASTILCMCNVRVDFEQKKIRCTTVVPDTISSAATPTTPHFDLDYDRLVIAVGAQSNTFNIPGVAEHAYFLKDVTDARRIRQRVIDCFELAAQPTTDAETRRRLLHFAVVGGGPTGIELSAEIQDLIRDDMRRHYPDLVAHVRMTVYDVAPRILGSFDEKLAEYAAQRFRREGIVIRTGTRVERVTATSLELVGGGSEGYGVLVWATGLTPNPLVSGLGQGGSTVAEVDRTGRLVTNDMLQVFKAGSEEPLSGVYAMGDCAVIRSNDLPATAQVANQKANYLSAAFNQEARDESGKQVPPFKYRFDGMLAYVGGWRAIAQLKPAGRRIEESGPAAWLFWRSAYFTMSVSWRNKVLIPMYWFLTWVFGRDISRF